MASANATRTTPIGDNSTEVWTWVLTSTATSGNPVMVANGDVTVQVGSTGDTFNAATIAIEGSNDNGVYTTLTDQSNAALSFTANGLKQVEQKPIYIQPVATGTPTQVTVVMTVRRPQPTRN